MARGSALEMEIRRGRCRLSLLADSAQVRHRHCHRHRQPGRTGSRSPASLLAPAALVPPVLPVPPAAPAATGPAGISRHASRLSPRQSGKRPRPRHGRPRHRQRARPARRDCGPSTPWLLLLTWGGGADWGPQCRLGPVWRWGCWHRTRAGSAPGSLVGSVGAGALGRGRDTHSHRACGTRPLAGHEAQGGPGVLWGGSGLPPVPAAHGGGSLVHSVRGPGEHGGGFQFPQYRLHVTGVTVHSGWGSRCTQRGSQCTWGIPVQWGGHTDIAVHTRGSR